MMGLVRRQINLFHFPKDLEISVMKWVDLDHQDQDDNNAEHHPVAVGSFETR